MPNKLIPLHYQKALRVILPWLLLIRATVNAISILINLKILTILPNLDQKINLIYFITQIVMITLCLMMFWLINIHKKNNKLIFMAFNLTLITEMAMTYLIIRQFPVITLLSNIVFSYLIFSSY